MNDSMSILLATTILALGGLGLYMFKISDDKQSSEEYNEEGLTGSSFFNWGSSNEDNDELNDEEIIEDVEDDYEYKPRKRNTKTLKNRKSTTNSRRRY
jgi:hypothetical protein